MSLQTISKPADLSAYGFTAEGSVGLTATYGYIDKTVPSAVGILPTNVVQNMLDALPEQFKTQPWARFVPK